MNALLFNFHGFTTLDKTEFNYSKARRLLVTFFVALMLSLSPLIVSILSHQPSLLFSPTRFLFTYGLVFGCGFVFLKTAQKNYWKSQKAEVIHVGILCFWIGFLGLFFNELLSFLIVIQAINEKAGLMRIVDSMRYDVLLNAWSVYCPLGILFASSAVFLFYQHKLDTGLTVSQKNFGSAEWATQEDFEKINAYNPKNGIFVGTDQNYRPLYLPMMNKLTLSPPGGGKSSSSSIPLLLSHTGPAFVFDVKGELWATTARYRHEVLGHQVVVIDPFGITQQKSFKAGKSKVLLKEYHVNPFDWIPEERKARDRMLNSFAASLVINEGGSINHFDENAKILIRGCIDYLMNRPKEERSLPELYRLMSLDVEKANAVFEVMSAMQARAGAAANQINRVGMDERGSILSTSYRQIDWMGDSNIQETLAESNFNLQDFLKGQMDIFVILPEDQIKEHARLFRMLLVLLMNTIIQADPSDLPNEPMHFLCEEIAQLGASPDIEQCIEVLRARGVIVSTVFQTLSQVKMFSKPDLFLTAPLKVIFTNDDPETLKWIQERGGDRTILTKSVSTNRGDSHQTAQVLNGSISTGEGESVQETGVKLIQLNDISEMPLDEQFIFILGKRPIRAKKVRYFENPVFAGRYDQNPLEKRAMP